MGGASKKGIEDRRTDGWTDIIFSLLSTQTDGQTGGVAARGSVEPIEFPSLMRKTKERQKWSFVACDLEFLCAICSLYTVGEGGGCLREPEWRKVRVRACGEEGATERAGSEGRYE